MDDFKVVAAHDVAEALVALGWNVTPDEDHFECWRIGDHTYSDDELLGVAARQSIFVLNLRAQ